ncbi:MAG: BlaI/MecI/CopY family transcriptional regulator [Gammaproteobacteria bacterium]|nr:BlaI/MecI/CopY family transcriptional regulator [Gammaproteobacteria bacterium]
MPEKYQLTPVEHELMEILWSLGQGTVRAVLNHLPKNRDLAYTSVSTILRILQQKKILAIEKVGRQHIYRPLLTKQAFANHSIKTIVKQIFSGKPLNLVAHLVDQQALSLEEIKAIQDLLEMKKRETS